MANSDLITLARAISWLCGWVYTICWSLSFYPQPLKNYRRRTTLGLLPDFPLLNVAGFSCYTISTAAFLLSPVIRRQYAARHPASPIPTVRANDLAFGLHACVLVYLTYSQFFPRLWGWKDTGAKRHATKLSLGLVYASGLAVVVYLITVAVTNDHPSAPNSKDWALIDVIYLISYIKLLLTFFKYLPQLLENYRRKSTSGWSIWQILLDIMGGVLSLVQLVIDSALQSDWSGVTGNPVKLGLANISIAFDICFIIQHYVLYGSGEDGVAEAGLLESNGDLTNERRSLLGSASDGREDS